MKTGKIKFVYEDGTTPSLEVELADNNLWLTKYEIARLFNCFVQKIDANLRSIFKEHLLWETDCCRCNRYIDKGVEKQTVYYSLETLIFLSYRINTMETKIFRQFANTALREHLQKDKTPKHDLKFVWLYSQMQNYMLN